MIFINKLKEKNSVLQTLTSKEAGISSGSKGSKAHEVATRGGSIGAALVRSVFIVMLSEEERDWEHFCSFGDIF